MEGLVGYPPQVAQHYRSLGYWEDRTLWSVFSECFDAYAERVALVTADERVSFAEVGERSARLADALGDLGLSRGDRIVVQLANCPEFVYLFFACQRLGLVPLLALPQHREHEIGHYIEFVGAAAYAVPAAPAGSERFDFLDFARRMRETHKCLEHVLVAGSDLAPDLFSLTEAAGRAGGAGASRPGATGLGRSGEGHRAASEGDGPAPMDPCCLLLSGGTTGIPKVIARTHNDYLYNARVSAACNGVEPDSSVVVCLPVAHNYPLNAGLLAFWLAGATVVLAASTQAADVLGLVAAHRTTHVEAVPSLLVKWLNDPAASDIDLSCVRVLNSAAQKLQPELCDRVEARFPNATVQEIFGMTEGLLMMNRLNDPPAVRRNTVGRPISEADEVRLVDEDGNDVAPGEIGELLCRGPYTFRGYLNSPEVNARVITDDGYYRSGDLLRRDPSGNYVIEGRMKDLVNRGGEKISVEEVEDMLLAHPGVRYVACVPMPDEMLGEKMCAFVIPSGGPVTLDELREFLAARGLARFKWPERLELVDELPLSNIGKVQKNVLAARAAELVRDATVTGTVTGTGTETGTDHA